MGRDIYEEIAAQHLQLNPGTFVRLGHNPGDESWIADVDVLAIDVIAKRVMIIEVKSGSLVGIDGQLHKHIQDNAPKIRDFLLSNDVITNEWVFGFTLYQKSHYGKRVLPHPWHAIFLCDALNESIADKQERTERELKSTPSTQQFLSCAEL